MYNLGDIKGGYTLINDGDLPRLPQSPRPEGVHLSGILSKIFGYSDKVVPETMENQSNFESSNLMELGLMFEDALKHRINIIRDRMVELYSDEYIEPEGLYVDGIYLTPDLYNVNRCAYLDIKFTRKSSSACPGDPRMAYWESQIKAYCHADGCNTGQLMVCHVNGSGGYAKDNDAVFNVWERVYSDEELVANWATIVAHKGDV